MKKMMMGLSVLLLPACTTAADFLLMTDTWGPTVIKLTDHLPRMGFEPTFDIADPDASPRPAP